MNFESKNGEEIKDFSDLRGNDLSLENLSSMPLETLLACKFDTETIWPPKDNLPEGFDPATVLENGKNPGLGIKDLHNEGITGRGIHLAVIDQKISNPTHKEYKVFSSSTEYISEKEEVSMHGPAVSSILVGKSCGVAPEAELHHFAMPAGKPDFSLCAKILSNIVKDNENLSTQEKVRVLSCSFGYMDRDMSPALQEWIDAKSFARNQGVIIIDASEDGGMPFSGGGSAGDKDDFDSYDIWLRFKSESQEKKKEIMSRSFVVPCDYRTFASSWSKENQYMYSGKSGISWSIPYLAGLIALGLQVNEDLSQQQVVDAINNTIYTNKKGVRVINPKKFIETIKDN